MTDLDRILYGSRILSYFFGKLMKSRCDLHRQLMSSKKLTFLEYIGKKLQKVKNYKRSMSEFVIYALIFRLCESESISTPVIINAISADVSGGGRFSDSNCTSSPNDFRTDASEGTTVGNLNNLGGCTKDSSGNSVRMWCIDSETVFVREYMSEVDCISTTIDAQSINSVTFQSHPRTLYVLRKHSS